MTGGTAVILGPVGSNFGAGMTGGMAFILDTDDQFERRANGESIVWQRLASGHWEAVLKELVEEHAKATGSKWSAERSEERRVGKEGDSTGRYRWWAYT